jgi:2-oxoglutarate ferredoxin oxidoreductase subunit gamma
MRLTEIRIAGFGGQGVILAAAIIGKASCIFQNNFATMTQSFGPEARGGSSSAQVILSDEPVTYPYITQPDILVVMSQEAFTRFSPELKDGGLLIVEQDLVRVGPLRAPASQCPERAQPRNWGRRWCSTSSWSGSSGRSPACDPERKRWPFRSAAFQQLNLQAFDKGFAYGVSLIAERTENGSLERPALEAGRNFRSRFFAS